MIFKKYLSVRVSVYSKVVFSLSLDHLSINFPINSTSPSPKESTMNSHLSTGLGGAASADKIISWITREKVKKGHKSTQECF